MKKEVDTEKIGRSIFVMLAILSPFIVGALIIGLGGDVDKVIRL